MLRRTFNTLLGLFFLPKLPTVQSEEPFSYCEEVVIEEAVDKILKEYRKYVTRYNLQIDISDISIYDINNLSSLPHEKGIFGVYSVIIKPYCDVAIYYTDLSRLGSGRKEYEQFLNDYEYSSGNLRSKLAKEIERRIRASSLL